MRTPPRILVADRSATYLEVLQVRVAAQGCEVITAADGEEALAMAREQEPDLILLDVAAPALDGLAVLRRLRADASLPLTPIIMIVAAGTAAEEILAGLDAGADEYLTRPVDPAALVARVKSMLSAKELHDLVREQAMQLAVQSEQLADWNQTLEEATELAAVRLAEWNQAVEHVNRLKRFLSPQVAELIVSSGDESFLDSHRREIAMAFCDLRGFTPFSETAEPEDVMGILREYHAAMGELIFQYEGTLEKFAGDGLTVFFNDPLPCPDPAARAVRMAVAMRERMDELLAAWRRRGYYLGFGVGIALGYATLGNIGFEGRLQYSAIGSVANLASRLCDTAEAGQILISQRVYAEVADCIVAERMPDVTLKGFLRPTPVYSVLRLRED